MIIAESYSNESWPDFIDFQKQGRTDTLQRSRALDRLSAWLNRALKQLLGMLGWLCAGLLLVGGWLLRGELPLQAESGLGYALGVFAICCMFVLLIFPLRKRFNILRFLGPARNWFVVHMTLGVTVPIAALYHSNFQLGSLNSQIALVCAFLVAGSGLVGRFLYRNIYTDWSGKKSAIRKRAAPNLFSSRELQFLALLVQRLDSFDQRILDVRGSLWQSSKALWLFKVSMYRERQALKNFSVKQVRTVALRNPTIAREQARLLNVIERYVLFRTLRTRQLVRVQTYERLFALWHFAHLPFFFLLLVSVFVHVLAVHLY